MLSSPTQMDPNPGPHFSVQKGSERASSPIALTVQAESGVESGSFSEPFALPKYDNVYAAAARRAGRLNASYVSDEEKSELLNERQALLDKKFAGAITRPEELRLAYVRWSLDRIEDARHGHILDRLEASIVQYERALAELIRLRSELDALTSERR